MTERICEKVGCCMFKIAESCLSLSLVSEIATLIKCKIKIDKHPVIQDLIQGYLVPCFRFFIFYLGLVIHISMFLALYFMISTTKVSKPSFSHVSNALLKRFSKS